MHLDINLAFLPIEARLKIHRAVDTRTSDVNMAL